MRFPTIPIHDAEIANSPPPPHPRSPGRETAGARSLSCPSRCGVVDLRLSSFFSSDCLTASLPHCLTACLPERHGTTASFAIDFDGTGA